MEKEEREKKIRETEEKNVDRYLGQSHHGLDYATAGEYQVSIIINLSELATCAFIRGQISLRASVELDYVK